MSPNRLIANAATAIASARLLLSTGDTDGACNRAYYGMFDAARAALATLPERYGKKLERTHTGLISAFGRDLVKSGKAAQELGRSFNHLHRIRLIADYSGDPIELPVAEHAVGDMRQLLANSMPPSD